MATQIRQHKIHKLEKLQYDVFYEKLQPPMSFTKVCIVTEATDQIG